MVPQDNHMAICPIWMGWEIAIELYLYPHLGYTDEQDCRLGDSLTPILTKTRSLSLEQLLTQASWTHGCRHSKISQSPRWNHNQVVSYLDRWNVVAPWDCLEHEADFSNHQFLLAVYSKIIDHDITHIRPGRASANFWYIWISQMRNIWDTRIWVMDVLMQLPQYIDSSLLWPNNVIYSANWWRGFIIASILNESNWFGIASLDNINRFKCSMANRNYSMNDWELLVMV
jgi:hypothetical protein